ncbi:MULTISPECIES: hypothetical protein [unclassified Microcoleus]
MTAFRFLFPDDDEGFEIIEDAEAVEELEEDEDEEASQIDDEVAWETEED